MLNESSSGCVYARQRVCGVSRVIELLATTARESTSVMSEEQELDHHLGMSSNGSPEVADGLLPYRLDSIGLHLLKLADESGNQDCIDQIKEKGRHQRNNQKRLPRCSVLLRYRRHVRHGRWC